MEFIRKFLFPKVDPASGFNNAEEILKIKKQITIGDNPKAI
jgi:hypothetical protein